MNEENLKSFVTMDPEKRKAANKKGGQNSGRRKREARIIKDILCLILEEKTESGDKYGDAVSALVDKAISGDVRAFEVIRDTLGQKPVEEVKATIDSVNINVSVEDEC